MIRGITGLRITYIDIDSILPCPSQARKDFDSGELIKLSRSIKQYGMLQPVSVRKNGKMYELVAGERRLRAARMAGFAKVPAIVRSMREEEALSLALMENTHRRQLTYFDEAESYMAIMGRLGLSREELAAKMGITRDEVDRKLELLKCSETLRKKIEESNMSEKAAYAVLRADSEELRLRAVEEARLHGYDEKQIEKFIEEAVYNTEHPEKALRKQLVKSARVYVNTIKRTIDMMRKAGLDAMTVSNENDRYIEYVIKIAK